MKPKKSNNKKYEQYLSNQEKEEGDEMEGNDDLEENDEKDGHGVVSVQAGGGDDDKKMNKLLKFNAVIKNNPSQVIRYF